MTPLPFRLTRWVLCALFVAAGLAGLPVRAWAQDFYADLNRDGVRDVVRLQNAPIASLRVWLSGAKSPLRLKTRFPIVHVAVGDVDGDGRADVIAYDSADKLHVWHSTARGSLRRSRPHRVPVAPGVSKSGGVRGTSDAGSAAAAETTSSAPPFDMARPTRLQLPDVSGRLVFAPSIPLLSRDALPHRPRGPPVT